MKLWQEKAKTLVGFFGAFSSIFVAYVSIGTWVINQSFVRFLLRAMPIAIVVFCIVVFALSVLDHRKHGWCSMAMLFVLPFAALVNIAYVVVIHLFTSPVFVLTGAGFIVIVPSLLAYTTVFILLLVVFLKRKGGVVEAEVGFDGKRENQ
ncbi:MAG: hypothetical protein FWD86_02705 [Firmicutes bacterium]|nr:hypothetical protein [Bacillota bacterium]